MSEDTKTALVASSTTSEHPVFLTSERRFKRGARDGYKLIDRNEEEVELRKFSGPVAKVGRAYGFTMNLGNYEMARFDISVEVPCEVEDMEEADEFAKQFITDRIQTEWDSRKSGEES